MIRIYNFTKGFLFPFCYDEISILEIWRNLFLWKENDYLWNLIHITKRNKLLFENLKWTPNRNPYILCTVSESYKKKTKKEERQMKKHTLMTWHAEIKYLKNIIPLIWISKERKVLPWSLTGSSTFST